ncbi:MAG: lysophospholipid acyltransferase family protein [Verrucomicrobia bacterium]|nr:MAG: lysophospholipid acyltransferase family protein [Verrucomicrobiota bacterium]
MVTNQITENPFRLNIPTPHPAWRQPVRAAAGALERVLQLDRLNQLYGEFRAHDNGHSFAERVLEFHGVKTELLAEEVAALPRTGPVVVVANHPFGGIEGMVLAKIFQDLRPDMRVLANSLLARIPECRNFMFFVNPFGGQGAARQNVVALKQALRWLQQGGMLVTFPAGEVARFDLRAGRVAEAPWNVNIARIVRHARASVVPVFIAGENGPLFHAAGLVHPRLRTALLPQEFLNKRNTTIRVRLGKPVAFDKLARFAEDAQMIQYLRVKTETLAHRGATFQALEKQAPAVSKPWKKSAEPVAPAAPSDALRRDIAALDDTCTLLRQDQFRVICARAQQLPAVLPEIGRLREVTFRAVGEGTGRARDLDRFDTFYLHLFIWNEEAGEIVGAYRLGPTDEIVPRYGLRGLYTNTLFKFRQPLVKHLTPALELGRSFVRMEYQRGYLPLLLLWKGVCHFVSQNPRYRHLFGPVSISNDYRSVSRHLIAQNFPRAPQTPKLARWVSPRHPLRAGFGAAVPHVPAELAGDVQTLAELIEDIEHGRGLPVLLRQYLKLGGEVLAFNVDPAFNQALDALIVVDLVRADAIAIGRYMGAENLKRYHALHRAV